MRRWRLVLMVAGWAAAGCSGPADKPAATPPAGDAAAGRPREAEAEAPPKLAEFRPFRAPDGQFQVDFPGQPAVHDAESIVDPAQSKVRSYAVVAGDRTYVVRVAHYTEKRDPAHELEEYAGRLLRRGGDAKLIESREVAMKGRPGKEVVFTSAGDVIHHARVYVGDGDIIQVTCDLPDTPADRANARAFVESFEFLH